METTLNHNNIYERFKELQSHFESVIKGYHMINKSPIKESVWEEVNCDIVSNVCSVTDEAKGNHMSGKDNRFDEFNISNYFGWNVWTLPLIMMIIGVVVSLYVIFNVIPISYLPHCSFLL